MLHFHMEGFTASATKWSPFLDNRVAVSTGANFGLAGNGRLWTFQLTDNGLVLDKRSVKSCGMHTPQMISNHL